MLYFLIKNLKYLNRYLFYMSIYYISVKKKQTSTGVVNARLHSHFSLL